MADSVDHIRGFKVNVEWLAGWKWASFASKAMAFGDRSRFLSADGRCSCEELAYYSWKSAVFKIPETITR
jgi:hypothetical protein